MRANIQQIPYHSRVQCFVELGKTISELSTEFKTNLALAAKNENAWFTENYVLLALQNLSYMLNEISIENFVLNYPKLKNITEVKRIGVIMAGNIPLVGFHDAMCVLLSGHKLVAKLSKDDNVLMRFIFETLIKIEPLFETFIETTDRIHDIDAVICTGNDNSGRYFEHYFGKYPNIIRKNRTSVAVLVGNETPDELRLLADDIFTYYGLGCRNVSKIFIPLETEITKIIDAFESYHFVIEQHKYANNYTYNRAIFLLNQEPFLDNGFLLFKESESNFAPPSVLLYERYSEISEIIKKVDQIKDNLQCVIGKMTEIEGSVYFGNSQCPLIQDYADNRDTLEFLLGL